MTFILETAVLSDGVKMESLITIQALLTHLSENYDVCVDSLQYWQFWISTSEAEDAFCGPHAGAICTYFTLCSKKLHNTVCLVPPMGNAHFICVSSKGRKTLQSLREE